MLADADESDDDTLEAASMPASSLVAAVIMEVADDG
jgi:hypothetical protein